MTRRWMVALLLLALPAFVSVWGGWVQLGTLTGFGVVQPFPGIPVADAWRVDTRITLPIGMEVYAAMAFAAAVAERLNRTARLYAAVSAAVAIVLGGVAQATAHTLIAHHATRAPDVITQGVSVLTVLVFAAGVALFHLVRRSATVAENVTETAPAPVPVPEAGSQGEAVAALEDVTPWEPAPPIVPPTIPSVTTDDVPALPVFVAPVALAEPEPAVSLAARVLAELETAGARVSHSAFARELRKAGGSVANGEIGPLIARARTAQDH